MNTLDLTKKLISIPSFVDQKTNEREIGDFLYDYLKKFSWLTVEKQYIEGMRFNVIAKDKYPTKVLICDHMDTVQPQTGWNKNESKPVVKGNKHYGLGSSDSKGNIATVLSSLENIKGTRGLMLLFYIDEEYDFAGVKGFLKGSTKKLNLKIIASADGGDLEIGNACRGLIEISFQIKGEAGHAANPSSGKNAIVGTLKAYEYLKSEILKFKSLELGSSTINLARLMGGQAQGNIIPDFAECIIEIRTANEKLNAKKAIDIFRQSILKQGLALQKADIRYDLGSWITSKESLDGVRRIFKSRFTPAALRGYVDLQMLWEAFNKPVCFTFGVGEPGTAHKAQEYVKIDKLEKGVNFWTAFIKENCSVQ